ncbi:hypothetical protein CWR43_35195 [Rhizobium sullae]|uniref:Uncharacterized protein n=1 Tax=Rhizobium sullae TaxID=50338 RepID=A0A2N0CYN7_RHISU|nr:hypothetical protein CWR43_35195 [Rhizobium sullae]
MSSIETIGEAWNAGWEFSATCRGGTMDTGMSSRKCDWKYQLDTMTLLATRGRDFPIMNLADRFRCPRCGSRSIRVLFITPGSGSRKTASK